MKFRSIVVLVTMMASVTAFAQSEELAEALKSGSALFGTPAGRAELVRQGYRPAKGEEFTKTEIDRISSEIRVKAVRGQMSAENIAALAAFSQPASAVSASTAKTTKGQVAADARKTSDRGKLDLTSGSNCAVVDLPCNAEAKIKDWDESHKVDSDLARGAIAAIEHDPSVVGRGFMTCDNLGKAEKNNLLYAIGKTADANGEVAEASAFVGGLNDVTDVTSRDEAVANAVKLADPAMCGYAGLSIQRGLQAGAR